jgi:hypothetical protein
MFPTPQTLKPNTFNNHYELNLTKVGFGNGDNYKFIPLTLGFSMNATNKLLIISPLHGHGISQDANVHFGIVLMSKTSFKN